MDVVRRFSERKLDNKQRFKEMETELRLQRMLEEKQKSSNRREYERYMKEQEEEKIKQALENIRKKQTRESWNGKNSLMNQKMTILKEDRPILMEKNIFLDNKTKIPLTQRNMYFK